MALCGPPQHGTETIAIDNRRLRLVAQRLR